MEAVVTLEVGVGVAIVETDVPGAGRIGRIGRTRPESRTRRIGKVGRIDRRRGARGIDNAAQFIHTRHAPIAEAAQDAGVDRRGEAEAIAGGNDLSLMPNC